MRPIPTPQSNIVYKAPEGGELGGQDPGRMPKAMPAHREIIAWMIAHPIKGPMIVSDAGPHTCINKKGELVSVPGHPTVAIHTTWQLDTDDLAKLAASSLMRVSIVGSDPPPPFQVNCIGPGEDRVDPPIARAHLERAVGLLVGKLADMGFNPAHPDAVMSGLDECLLETAGIE